MMNKNRFILLSPILIICIVNFITRISYLLFGESCWFITALSYWLFIGLMCILFANPWGKTLNQWFKKSNIGWNWKTISILIGGFPILISLLPNTYLLFTYPSLTIGILLFAIINPVLEEAYWRGLLLDAGKGFPKWTNIIYSTFWFVISHPLMWGVFSIASKGIYIYLSTFITGIIWSMLRIKTKSLRWSLYSHILSDIGNMSIFAFYNLYIPFQPFFIFHH